MVTHGVVLYEGKKSQAHFVSSYDHRARMHKMPFVYLWQKTDGLYG